MKTINEQRLERERDEAREKYRTAVSNQKRESFRLHREIKDLSRQLDAIRAVFKNKANDKNWEPGETLAETGARVLRERDEAMSDLEFRRGLYKVLEEANNRLRTANEEAVELARTLKQERDEAREVLIEIAEASGFDNIGNWARNKAKSAIYR